MDYVNYINSVPWLDEKLWIQGSPASVVPSRIQFIIVDDRVCTIACCGGRRPPLSNVLKENELDGNSVIKQYLTTASDGKDYNVAQNMIDNVK